MFRASRGPQPRCTSAAISCQSTWSATASARGLGNPSRMSWAALQSWSSPWSMTSCQAKPPGSPAPPPWAGLRGSWPSEWRILPSSFTSVSAPIAAATADHSFPAARRGHIPSPASSRGPPPPRCAGSRPAPHRPAGPPPARAAAPSASGWPSVEALPQLGESSTLTFTSLTRPASSVATAPGRGYTGTARRRGEREAMTAWAADELRFRPDPRRGTGRHAVARFPRAPGAAYGAGSMRPPFGEAAVSTG